MHRLLAPALLLLTLVSCSSPADDSFLPGPPDARGVPLGPAGAFTATTSLAWSAATNELVGLGSGSTGLVAMNAASGALRSLAPGAPLSFHVSGSGAVVAWDAFVGAGDTLALWRGPVSGGAAERVTSVVGLSPHAFAAAPNDAAFAWSRTPAFDVDPESIRVEIYPVPAAARASSGAAAAPHATLEPGIPVLFSPGGDELLYRPGGAPSAYARWALGTHASTPFPLGLPAEARGASLRWDAAGIRALYAIGARAFWVRNATTGTDTPLLYTPGDSIAFQSPVWSPDGTKAALWTQEWLPTQQVTQARLYVVNTGGPVSAAVVAIGIEAPGAITFSPDSKRVAYLFGTQVRVANVPGATPALADAAPR